MYRRRAIQVPARVVLIALLGNVLASGCASLQQPRPADLRGEAGAAYEAEDYAAAAEGFIDYLQRRPDDAEAWFRLGNAQAQLGRLEAAESALRQALALEPGMARARHNLGLVQIQLGVTAVLMARRDLPEVDDPAARTMEYLACLMETFMGYPRPQTCEPGFADDPAARTD